EADEVFVMQVASDLDVAEEAEAGLVGDALEGARDRLQLGMVRRDPEAHEPPRRRQPLDHVDLDGDVGVEQRARGVEAGRPRAHDCDAQRGLGHTSMLDPQEGAAATSAGPAARSRHASAAFQPVHPRMMSAFSGWSQPSAFTPYARYARKSCTMNRPAVIPPIFISLLSRVATEKRP